MDNAKKYSMIYELFGLTGGSVSARSTHMALNDSIEIICSTDHDINLKRCIWSIITGGYLLEYIYDFYNIDLFKFVMNSNHLNIPKEKISLLINTLCVIFLGETSDNYIKDSEEYLVGYNYLEYKTTINNNDQTEVMPILNSIFVNYDDQMLSFAQVIRHHLQHIYEQFTIAKKSSVYSDDKNYNIEFPGIENININVPSLVKQKLSILNDTLKTRWISDDTVQDTNKTPLLELADNKFQNIISDLIDVESIAGIVNSTHGNYPLCHFLLKRMEGRDKANIYCMLTDIYYPLLKNKDKVKYTINTNSLIVIRTTGWENNSAIEQRLRIFGYFQAIGIGSVFSLEFIPSINAENYIHTFLDTSTMLADNTTIFTQYENKIRQIEKERNDRANALKKISDISIWKFHNQYNPRNDVVSYLLPDIKTQTSIAGFDYIYFMYDKYTWNESSDILNKYIQPIFTSKIIEMYREMVLKYRTLFASNTNSNNQAQQQQPQEQQQEPQQQQEQAVMDPQTENQEAQQESDDNIEPDLDILGASQETILYNNNNNLNVNNEENPAQTNQLHESQNIQDITTTNNIDINKSKKRVDGNNNESNLDSNEMSLEVDNHDIIQDKEQSDIQQSFSDSNSLEELDIYNNDDSNISNLNSQNVPFQNGIQSSGSMYSGKPNNIELDNSNIALLINREESNLSSTDANVHISSLPEDIDLYDDSADNGNDITEAEQGDDTNVVSSLLDDVNLNRKRKRDEEDEFNMADIFNDIEEPRNTKRLKTGQFSRHEIELKKNTDNLFIEARLNRRVKKDISDDLYKQKSLLSTECVLLLNKISLKIASVFNQLDALMFETKTYGTIHLRLRDNKKSNKRWFWKISTSSIINLITSKYSNSQNIGTIKEIIRLNDTSLSIILCIYRILGKTKFDAISRGQHYKAFNSDKYIPNSIVDSADDLMSLYANYDKISKITTELIPKDSNRKFYVNILVALPQEINKIISNIQEGIDLRSKRIVADREKELEDATEVLLTNGTPKGISPSAIIQFTNRKVMKNNPSIVPEKLGFELFKNIMSDQIWERCALNIEIPQLLVSKMYSEIMHSEASTNLPNHDTNFIFLMDAMYSLDRRIIDTEEMNENIYIKCHNSLSQLLYELSRLPDPLSLNLTYDTMEYNSLKNSISKGEFKLLYWINKIGSNSLLDSEYTIDLVVLYNPTLPSLTLTNEVYYLSILNWIRNIIVDTITSTDTLENRDGLSLSLKFLKNHMKELDISMLTKHTFNSSTRVINGFVTKEHLEKSIKLWFTLETFMFLSKEFDIMRFSKAAMILIIDTLQKNEIWEFPTDIKYYSSLIGQFAWKILLKYMHSQYAKQESCYQLFAINLYNHVEFYNLIAYSMNEKWVVDINNAVSLSYTSIYNPGFLCKDRTLRPIQPIHFFNNADEEIESDILKEVTQTKLRIGINTKKEQNNFNIYDINSSPVIVSKLTSYY
jgi:hypothetical protein